MAVAEAGAAPPPPVFSSPLRRGMNVYDKNKDGMFFFISIFNLRWAYADTVSLYPCLHVSVLDGPNEDGAAADPLLNPGIAEAEDMRV